MTAAVLRDALSGVQDAIAAMGALPVPDRITAAEDCADLIASAADVLFTPVSAGPPKGEPGHSDVADAITRGAAILACRPGGVSFGGLHWHQDGHEDCEGPGELSVAGLDQREAKGAYYTPRDLAEEIVLGALEPLVYRPGPLQTADRASWRLIPSCAILDLRVADIAVGSGVFLVAGIRYLSGRLAEAWRREAEGMPVPSWPRDVFPPAGRDPLAMAARRLVIRCFYGADIDATAVELARLTVSLMAPEVPVPAALNLVCGDSLLGIRDIEQVMKIRMDPEPGMPDVLDRQDVMRRLAASAAYRRSVS